MQLLTFTIGSERYAIESRRVIEVLPLVPARPIPAAPADIRGVFTYRGRLVPMVDLGMRLAHTPVRARLSTRVMVVDCRTNAAACQAAVPTLGIAAENVLGMRSMRDATSSLPPLRRPDAPYLDRLLRIDDEIIQLVAVDQLLAPELIDSLTVLDARSEPRPAESTAEQDRVSTSPPPSSPSSHVR